MHKRFAVVLLAALSAAAVFVLPAQAGSNRNAHVLHAYGVKGLVKTKAALGGTAKPQVVNVVWTSAATMPTAREETGGGAAIGNLFYAIGGFTDFSVPTVTNANEQYNKASNTWTAKAPIPGAPSAGWADAAICVNTADKTIHVVNGVDGSFLYAAHQVYSTTTNTWSNLAPPNTVADGNFYSQDSGCAFIGGKMYLFGGYGLTDTGPHSVAAIQNFTWVYDPTTDSWSDALKAMQHPRLWMGYASNTTTAYAAGGTDNISTFVPINSTESFTPTGGWVARANLPKALLAPGESIVATHLLVYGGGDNTFTTQNKTYHCNMPPACASWATATFNLPSAKWFTIFASGASAFDAGGDTGSGVPVNTAEHLP
jgi:hypothetical protein